MQHNQDSFDVGNLQQDSNQAGKPVIGITTSRREIINSKGVIVRYLTHSQDTRDY